LDDPRKQNTNLLIAFFGEIDQGDHLSALTPLTVGSLESARMFYERADEKARAMPSEIDVTFIPRLKIVENQTRIAQLKTGQQQELALKTYRQIISTLNPAEWRQAEKLLYDNRQFFAEHLDDQGKQNTGKLVAFFAEINEGDRLSAITPVTIQNLESSLMFYQRAEEKSQAMPSEIDVAFIPRVKIDQNRSQIDQLKTQEQEMLAARKSEAEVITTPKKAGLKPAERQLTPAMEVKVAQQDFQNKNYGASMDHFQKAYSDQISNLQQTDKRRIRGLLALPARHRAEVIFLLEMDRLRKEKNDIEYIRQGLEEVYSQIDNGQGLWSIIPESKRRKIKRHIETISGGE
ncbi:MAG: hypothetical protein KKH68_09550, partial [Proteobacteria bacterium]|nr:hypothetical protein [Pseudomonadota bacterium]